MKHPCLLLAPALVTVGAGLTPISQDARSDGAVSLTDTSFLMQPIWDDGKAEIALYDIESTSDAGAGPTVTRRRAAMVLVKHDYNLRYMGKHESVKMNRLTQDDADVISSFMWGFFDVEPDYFDHSGFVTSFLHAAQRDLRPLKQTQTQVSLEGNSYRALVYLESGAVRREQTGDTFTAPLVTLPGRAGAYPILQVPLLVRALDFSATDTRHFTVLYPDPELTVVRVEAERLGVEAIETPFGKIQAERIEVRFEDPPLYPATLLGFHAPVETYWRGTAAHRPLVRIEGKGLHVAGAAISYTITLAEETRSTWWREDVREKLNLDDSP